MYIPEITQPWYADGTRALGTFMITETCFNEIKHQGIGRRYYQELSKSVLIVHTYNPEARKEFSTRDGFKVCTGARYIGGYIGDDKSNNYWLI